MKGTYKEGKDWQKGWKGSERKGRKEKRCARKWKKGKGLEEKGRDVQRWERQAKVWKRKEGKERKGKSKEGK